MTEMYRLKRELWKYFAYRLRESCKPYEEWEKIGVSSDAIEKLPLIQITTGMQNSSISSSISSYDYNKKLADFFFTVRFNGIPEDKYNVFCSGDKMQMLITHLELEVSRFYKKIICTE